MRRRDMLLAAMGATLAGIHLPAARAQGNWPDRPIRLIVPFPPAGGTDVISREIAAKLGAIGWNLVVDNRPGAGGNIGLGAIGKAKRGGLTAGNAGSGTVGHLAGEMFARRAGVEFVSVPYRGAGPVVTDLLAGRVDLFFANPLAVKGNLESGDLRAIAVTSAARMRTFPDVPTVAESGYEGFEAVNWTGLVAPARTPAPVVARLNEEVRKALRQEAVAARLADEGSEPMGSTPEEFRAFLTAEHAKWGKVVRDARVQLD
jgi:tripartite-type tricarboxylate transporter receptor subunit TctC